MGLCSSLCRHEDGKQEEQTLILGEPTGFRKIAGWDRETNQIISGQGQPIDFPVSSKAQSCDSQRSSQAAMRDEGER